MVGDFGGEVLEEGVFGGVGVEKREVVVDDGLGGGGVDKLGIGEDGVVEVRLKVVCGVGIDVYREVLRGCEVGGFGVGDGWVEVKVE